MKLGVLHQIYITNGVVPHQLMLPKEYHQAVLQMLHDDYGHQGLDCTLVLVRERFYWSTMYKDAMEYIISCHWCHVAKGHYTSPHMQQGSLVANNPLDLLCIVHIHNDKGQNFENDIISHLYSMYNISL